jgi:shikimate dehydrogenase
MAGDSLPDEIVDAIHDGQAVLDLVYAPLDTWLVAMARVRGALAESGLGMLVHQAGKAFTLMTGQPAPLEAMSAAVLAHLGRSGS